MLSIDREAGPATAIAAIPAALALAARRPGLATVLAALPAGVALFFRDPERTLTTRRCRPTRCAPRPTARSCMPARANPTSPRGRVEPGPIFLSAFDVPSIGRPSVGA